MVDFDEICNVCTRKAEILKLLRGYLILIRFVIVIVISILASPFWNTKCISTARLLGHAAPLSPSYFFLWFDNSMDLWWHGGSSGRTSDLQLIGHGFESCLGTIAKWP